MRRSIETYVLIHVNLTREKLIYQCKTYSTFSNYQKNKSKIWPNLLANAPIFIYTIVNKAEAQKHRRGLFYKSLPQHIWLNLIMVKYGPSSGHYMEDFLESVVL
ncbi:hypothetical protein ACB098_08G163400 [Castanea mollissima]